ncbi:uncharacterized protein LOC124542553 [Vanessa cardui]|uniref:uncharacterized protein LOC124542553 n=1 Tax=Vanessa cardui TaxID=171605 RepID=UPI001F13C065|nr:uncharacterized protein LOC124542553 [Vanessa cardui]
MSSGSDTAESQVNTRPRRMKKLERVHSADVTMVAPPSAQIKTPPFWPEKPAIWFAQVEGQFKLFGITDEATKFYQILSTLDRQYAAEVEDVITGPPDYNRLKAELIKRLSVSRENKVKQLLMHEQLGSRKPSQFLRHLQHLAGPDIPEEFLQTFWTSRLPIGIQPIVASQPTLPLDALAELADRVHDIATPTNQVAATSSSSPIELLTQQVAELTKQVSALTAQVNQRSRPRERRQSSRHRNRSQSRRSSSSHRRYPVCWYHSKFGSKARSCIKPCDYTSGNAPSNQ